MSYQQRIDDITLQQLAEAQSAIQAALSGSLEAPQILMQVLDAASQFIPYDGAAWMDLRRGGTGADFKTGVSVGRTITPGSLGGFLSAIKGGQSIWFSEQQDSESEWIRSQIASPIRENGQVTGFILFASTMPDTYSTTHTLLLEAIAGQVGVALFCTRNREREQQVAAVSEQLCKAVTALGNFTSLESTLDHIASNLREVVPYDCMLVLRCLSDQPEIEALYDPGGQIRDLSALEKGWPTIQETLRTGKPLVLSQQDSEAHPLWALTCGRQAAGWLCIPLIVHDLAIGLLVLGSLARGYTEWEVEACLQIGQIAVLAIYYDAVTEELDAVRARLKRADNQLLRLTRKHVAGELAEGVAHQINNPLAIITIDSELLLRRIPPDHPGYKSVSAIRRSAYRAGAIVQHLLSFSNVPDLHLKQLSVNETIEQALSIVRAQIEPHYGRIVVHLRRDLPLICGDDHYLLDVWLNLLLNSKEAIWDRPGGVIAVSTATVRSGNAVRVLFEDNGPGIPQEYLEDIFKPFFTTKESGKGLGLSICHDIVTRHRGSIVVSSLPSKGAAFAVILPVRQDGQDSLEQRIPIMEAAS